ncbi:DUF4231 domain-containing protein [Actinokineospora sp. 24-640]
MTSPAFELPGFFVEADRASLRGQRRMLRWSRARLLGAVGASVGGALSLKVDNFDLWAILALLSFGVALVAEIALMTTQPERDWYAGRALAESAKTLAWRYAVAANPFPPSMGAAEARQLMHERLAEVAEKGKDRLVLGVEAPGITSGMTRVRETSFGERKRIYLEERVAEQRSWYAAKAATNARNATHWRVALIAAEVAAIVLAGGRAFGAWNLDVSGIIAAAIAAGAAWLGLKQYSSLASAYSIAATELSLSGARLSDASEESWVDAMADAEEAISREHTMWIASRAGLR